MFPHPTVCKHIPELISTLRKNCRFTSKMVITCSAPGCSVKKDTINSKTTTQFHRFPLRKQDICAKWIKAMRCPNFKPSASSYLCGAHFLDSDYEAKASTISKTLKPHAVPSVFEKRRPGRKKKVLNGGETGAESFKKSPENYEIRKGMEEIPDEFALIEAHQKGESNLVDIIGDRDKGTLQVLIVGEDGKITNSEYIFKKEIFGDDEFVLDSPEFTQENNHSTEGTCNKSHQEPVDVTPVLCSSPECLSRVTNLEGRLKWSRKKISLLQIKCKRINSQNKQLKLLLKMLILKRGRGEKSLNQLLSEYHKYEYDDTKVQVKEEDLYMQN